jgi:hypothetical protein
MSIVNHHSKIFEGKLAYITIENGSCPILILLRSSHYQNITLLKINSQTGHAFKAKQKELGMHHNCSSRDKKMMVSSAY